MVAACSIHAADLTALVLNAGRSTVSLTCNRGFHFKLKAITELIVSEFFDLALNKRVNCVCRQEIRVNQVEVRSSLQS